MVIRLVLVSFFLVCFNVHRASSFEDPFMKWSATTIGTFAGRAAQMCNQDDLAFSPAGRFLVLTRRETLPYSLVSGNRSFLTLDTQCVSKRGIVDQCFFYGEGLDGARPVAWAKRDATMFVVENLKALVALDFDPDNSYATFAGRSELSRDAATTISTSGSTPSRSARSEAIRLMQGYRNAEQLLSKSSILIAGTLTNNSQVSAVGFDPKSLRAEFAFERRRFPLPYSRAFLNSAILSSTSNGRYVLSDRGWAGIVNSERLSNYPQEAFEEPIIRSRDSLLLGGYSPTGVKAMPSHVLRDMSSAVNGVRISDPGLALVAAAVGSGGDYVTAYRSAFGQYRLAGRIGKRPIDFSCGDTPPVRTRLSTRTVGSRYWRLSLVQIDTLQPRGVAVIFQGGPTNVATDALKMAAVRLYLRNGWSVVLPSYSGSAGSGVHTSTRLRRQGINAFVRDASALRSYLDRSFSGLPVIIHGESFGAVPAMALEAMVSSRAGGFYAGVPYLHSRPPEEWLKQSVVQATDPKYQRDWEAAVIGVTDTNRVRFNQSLHVLQSRRSTKRPALFLFGSLDASSRPEDLIPSMRLGTETVVVKGIHEFALTDPLARSALERWVSDRSR